MSDAAQHEEESLGKVTDWRPTKRLFRYLRPYAGRVGIAVVLLLITSAFEIVQPIFYKVAIDYYVKPSSGGPSEHAWLAAYMPADPLAGLNLLAVTFGALMVVSFLMDYVQGLLTLMTGQYVMYDLRQEIFRHLQRLHIGFYDRNPVGRLVTRVTNDVETLNELFTAGVNALFRDIVVLLGIIAVLFYYDWQLAILTLAALPLIGAVTIAFRNYARDAFRRTRTAIARINAFLSEHLSGMTVVQLFNREQRAAREFDAINEENRQAWRDAILAHALFYPAVEFLSVLAITAIVVYGGWQVGIGATKLGTIVAFLMYARRFFYPIQDLSEKYGILQQALASSERVFKLLDTPTTITSPAHPRPLPSTDGRGAGKVEFRNVSFAYKDEDWVLQDVSFTLEPGEVSAIVGHTGAGKTTLISLLLRFYDVQKGQILLDGIDIRELDLEDLRR
ncbi:MAG TPA: ABC transporter transmembrane domain-containing protein, partial [Candidatus Acidoferrales bacterium]|nr:ABC transporter transmembrane domain-containing protein [Candidatus Acidoferrales bacterium]